MTHSGAVNDAALPYFFVFGAPKSGTTWVQKALDEHPHLVCKGEGKFLMFRRELGKAAAAYSAFLEGYQKQVFGETFFDPIGRQEFDRLYKAFIELRLREDIPPGVHRIGNKDPEHGIDIDDLSSYFPDAAFLHVVRDPRDVIVSTWHHMKRVNPAYIAKVGSFQSFMTLNIGEWTSYVSTVRKVAKDKGLSLAEIRYEDLQTNPVETLAGAFRFLAVSDDEQTVRRCLDAASFEKASGGRAPGQADAASFYRKGEAGDWRNHMSAEEGRALLAATDGLAADLGYR